MPENIDPVTGARYPQPGQTVYSQTSRPLVAPTDKLKLESKEDHLAHITELARSLLINISPSGAQTVGEKILVHCGAIQDPKPHDDRMIAEHKAEQELEVQRAKERVELKTNPTDEDKALAAKVANKPVDKPKVEPKPESAKNIGPFTSDSVSRAP